MTTYFITISAHKQRSLFQGDGVAELMVATFLQCRDAGEFELHEYVVLPNHVHLLLSINDQQRLGRVVQLIKGRFSDSLRQNGIRFRAVWEEKYHHRRVRDNNEFAECARYIRLNAVQKGLAERPEEYAYSSARMPGLKPLIDKQGNLEASLDVRSIDPLGKAGASPNVRSTDSLGKVDAGLKARSMEFIKTLASRT